MGSTKGVTGKFGGNGPSPADHGARNDSFFLDEETHRLFAYVEIEDGEKCRQWDFTDIHRKWRDCIAPIMETHPDDDPVTKDLKRVFHMD